MRELVASRSVVGVLIGLYVLATLGAIPVPSFTLSRAGQGEDVAHSSYCSCVSCSPDSCCCAMLAPTNEDDGGIRMLGYSCHPTVTWFLAVLPPAVAGVEIITKAETPFGERCSQLLPGDREVAFGVPTPPPKAAT